MSLILSDSAPPSAGEPAIDIECGGVRVSLPPVPGSERRAGRSYLAGMESHWPAAPEVGLEAGEAWWMGAVLGRLAHDADRLQRWYADQEREAMALALDAGQTLTAEWLRERREPAASMVARARAADGTATHAEIARRLTGGPLADAPGIDAFAALRHRIGRVAAVERRIVHPSLRVTGRLDALCEWDGRLAVVDWKARQRPVPRVGDVMEVAGYIGMLRLHGVRVDLGVVVVLPTRDGRPWMVRMEGADLEAYVAGFAGLYGAHLAAERAARACGRREHK